MSKKTQTAAAKKVSGGKENARVTVPLFANYTQEALYESSSRK